MFIRLFILNLTAVMLEITVEPSMNFYLDYYVSIEVKLCSGVNLVDIYTINEASRSMGSKLQGFYLVASELEQYQILKNLPKAKSIHS